MAQPPKDIQAKMRQMAEEQRLRNQLKSQYDAEMAKRYNRDMVPFAQWMASRDKPEMASGGEVDYSKRENQNMADPAYRAYLENAQALEPDYTDVSLAAPVLRGLAGAAGMVGRAMAPATTGRVLNAPIGWKIRVPSKETLGEYTMPPPAVFNPRTAEEIAAKAAKKLPEKIKNVFMEDIPRNVAAAAGDLAAIVNRYQDSQKKAGGGEVKPIKLDPNSKAKAMIEDVYGQYPAHPFNPNQRAMVSGEGEDQQLGIFELKPSLSAKDAVELAWIAAHPHKQGVGSKTLQALQQHASQHGVGLTLFPWQHGNVSQAKLMKFYKKHGFIPAQKGAKNMIWRPEGMADGGVARLASGGEPPSLDTMRLALTKNRLGMHSPMEKAAMSVPRTKGTAQEFMTEMQKQPGFRNEELADRPITPREGKMTREEFVKHVKSHKAPQIEVEHRYAEDDQTHHEEYTHPGGENYREILIKRPAWKGNDRIMEKEAQLRRVGSDVMRGVYQGELDQLRAAKAAFGEVFPGNPLHFGGEPGILASLMVKDRSGPKGEKIYHIEEVQSDWHQQGRKGGYITNEEKNRIKEKLARGEKLTIDEQIARDRWVNKDTVPDAPHKKSWHELALKHALNEAVQGGYHGIAITMGQDLADRYDLSKQVDMIKVKPNPDGSRRVHVHVASSAERPVFDVRADGSIEPDSASSELFRGKSLDEVIGKEMADKIMTADDQRDYSGLDLKVGGEGMKGFYDKIVVDFLNKLGKKHGAQVGRVPIVTKPGSVEKAGTAYYQVAPKTANLHYFPIPESLRKQIKTEGLPQYAEGGDIE